MLEISPGWGLHYDLSPEWLFLRLASLRPLPDPAPPLAESVWNLVDRYALDRLVLELEDDVRLVSYLVGQIVLLHKRAHQHGGVFRLCALNHHQYDVIEALQLTDRFPNYASREDAVMGYPPRRPR